jgi:glycosyltransferase involved in cell wall biosynthesis
MKIALIAPVEETIPPQKYGGIEWIVYQLAHGMGAKGHEVDLYASADSRKESYYNLIPIADVAVRVRKEYYDNLPKREEEKVNAVHRTVELMKGKQYDIIHNHASWRFLQHGAPHFSQKTLTTHHGPLDLDEFIPVFRQYKDHFHVSISDNQRKALPELNYVATVYNGTDTTDFPYYEAIGRPHSHDHMIFLARMAAHKGAIEAAMAAKQAKRELHLYSKVDIIHGNYFELFQKHIDNEYVHFYGEIGMEDKVKYLQTARCLLVPIQWEEPFGLMFTEAMACGTPVITFARGSAPEIIEDGVSGLLVNQSEELKRGNWIVKKTGVEGLVEAIERMYSLSPEDYRTIRQAARRRVENNFTVKKMVDEYEKVYKSLL